MPRLGIKCSQQSSEAYCGAAVIQMLLRFRQPSQATPTQDSIYATASAMEKLPQGGIAPLALGKTLNQALGSEVYEVIEAKSGQEIVTKLVERSISPAAFHWKGGHWVVADGLELAPGSLSKATSLFVVDPTWADGRASDCKQVSATSTEIQPVKDWGGKCYCVVDRAKALPLLAPDFQQLSTWFSFGNGSSSVVEYLLQGFNAASLPGAISGSRIVAVRAIVHVADLDAKGEYWVAEIVDDLGAAYRAVVSHRGVASVGPSAGADEFLREGAGWLWKGTDETWDRGSPFRVVPGLGGGDKFLLSNGQIFRHLKGSSGRVR
jgi:hypothetical protein